MKTVINVDDYTVTLITDGDTHSLYSKHHEKWLQLRDVIREAMRPHIKEWKEDADNNRRTNNQYRPPST